MNHDIQECYDNNLKKQICANILNDLNKWFGHEESKCEYIENVVKYRFFYFSLANEAVAFYSIKQNNENVYEIYVCGVLEKYHNKGFGSALYHYIENILKIEGIKYIEVKTLDKSYESHEYDMTRKFYKKIGFIELDVLLAEWGNIPCLIMIKKIQ